MDSIRIALRAIRKNKLRAVLTVLGILIGVASVVVITALGDGARTSVGSQIESLGSNFIIVFPQQSNASGARVPSCARISGAVVRRCASGLAGFVNCCGMNASGLSRTMP